ncbi:MAG: YraN family protein [Pseudobdellovibrio sp.]
MSYRRGFNAEMAVVKLLTAENWQFIFYRLKTTISEIDLVFEKNNKILLIEVKSLNENWRSFERIGGRQLDRLKQNKLVFSFLFKDKIIEACVAWVNRKNEISFVKID